MAVITPCDGPLKAPKTLGLNRPSVALKSREPKPTKIKAIPTNMAASPTRVTTKAFLAALAAAGRSNQCPIRR